MDKLKQLRKEKKLTQAEVAKAIDVTQTSYGKYELGQRDPSNEVLQKLADYFNVSTDYLLGRSDVRRPGDVAALSSDVPYDDLPPEAIKELQQYREFLIQKYGVKTP